jgi:serine protease Do
MQRSRARLGLVFTLVGIIGIALGFVLSAHIGLPGAAHAAPQQQVPAPQVAPAVPPTGAGVSFVRLAKEVGPAVVSINVKITRQSSDFGGFDPFGGDGPQIGEGQGSGFIISPDGYVLTNDHVVGEASEIKVALSDGRELPGKVVGTDSRTDIALVKIEDKKPFAYVRLGDSDKVEIGEWVVAIGNPFGLDHTVTAGIVSAKGRRNIRPSGRRGLYDFIQTDASINPGNSGGPLINVTGEVIGINSAVNAAGQGIGFAIPINMAKTLVPMLKDHGKVDRSYLGIGLQDLTRELAKSYGMPDANGAIVNKIVPGSPADKAGFKPGDVITQFDGKPIKNADELVWLASTAGAGKSVNVTVTGRGGPRTLRVTMGTMPEERQLTSGRRRLPSGSATPAAGKLGIEVTPVTPEIAQELGLEKVAGVAVTDVDRRGAAAGALQRGDVIVSVNDMAVNDDQAFGKALADASAGQTLRMMVVREGAPMWLAFTLQ